MKITDDPTLIRFEESRTADPAMADCICSYCAPRITAASTQSKGGKIRKHTTVRGTWLATTVLAGAGVATLGLGTATANAESAPSHSGWDGSVFWFMNSSGEWRYTSHYDVYLARTGGDGTSTSASTSTSTSAGGSGGSQIATGDHEAAVDYALAQVGKPYVWGGNGPGGFDCSGLVQQAYLTAGLQLPRVADDQYAATIVINPGDLRRGDLIFWSSSGRASGIHHVAIYLGDGSYVEAPHPGTNVRVSALSRGYYPTHFGRP